MNDDAHDPYDGDPDEALADPVFAELFAALREAGRGPVPEMPPALLASLSSAAVARRRRGARGATVGLAVVGVLAGGVGAAAATGHLQQAVRPPAQVSEHSAGPGATVTPPRPAPTDVVPSRPPHAPAPSATTEPDAATSPDGEDDDATTPAVRPRATEAPRSRDDDTGGTDSGDGSGDGSGDDPTSETGGDHPVDVGSGDPVDGSGQDTGGESDSGAAAGS